MARVAIPKAGQGSYAPLVAEVVGDVTSEGFDPTDADNGASAVVITAKPGTFGTAQFHVLTGAREDLKRRGFKLPKACEGYVLQSRKVGEKTQNADGTVTQTVAYYFGPDAK